MVVCFLLPQALSNRPLSPVDVGILPVLTWLFLVAALLAFVGGTVHFALARSGVPPERRAGLAFAAALTGVAAVGYLLLTLRFASLMNVLIQPGQFGFATPTQALRPVLADVSTIRYGLWVVALPMATMTFSMLLGLRGRDATRALTLLPLLGFVMIAAWAVGEQLMGPDAQLAATLRLWWGAIGLVAYVAVVIFVFAVLRANAVIAEPEERIAYRRMSILVVTTWLVYPAGYFLPLLFPESRLVWFQLVLNAGDVINFTAPGVVMLLAARGMAYKKLGAVPPT